MGYLIHLHGASIGEVRCLDRLRLRLLQALLAENVHFILTYTSSSAQAWLERKRHDAELTHGYWNGRTISIIQKQMRLTDNQNTALIIAEKDRRASLLRLHRDSRFILNVEAKPPQSLKSQLYEKIWARSMKRISFYAVECREYAKDIRIYAPQADIRVVGTQKAAPALPLSPDDCNPQICLAFISALYHEIGEVRKTVSALAKRIHPLKVVIVPRYVGPGFLWKNGRRFTNKASGRIEGCRIVGSLEDLDEEIEGHQNTTVIYNSLGDVHDILRKTRVAVVCGSLARGVFHQAKGHNFLEPLAAGVPTVIGPYVRNWKYSVQAFVREGTLISTTPSKLTDCVYQLLHDDFAYNRQRMRISHSRLLHFHQGSSERLCEFVLHLFE